MPNDKEHVVGIDVSKDKLEIAVLGKKPTEPFANTKADLPELGTLDRKQIAARVGVAP